MNVRKRMLVVGLLVAASLAAAGPAQAAFPDFSRCPTTAADIAGCIHVKNTSGDLNIKGIQRSTRGIARNTRWPHEPRNRQQIRSGDGHERLLLDPGAGSRRAPRHRLLDPRQQRPSDHRAGGAAVGNSVRLRNVLDQNPGEGPARELPAGHGLPHRVGQQPGRSQSDHGHDEPAAAEHADQRQTGQNHVVSPTLLTVTGNVNVDNTFAVPGASRCGLGLGLINTLVNTKLRLPSAAGNNSIVVGNDVAIQVLE
jgi:hypothetical protein